MEFGPSISISILSLGLMDLCIILGGPQSFAANIILIDKEKNKTVSAFYTLLELLSFEECIYSYHWKYRASAASDSNLSHSAVLNL